MFILISLIRPVVPATLQLLSNAYNAGHAIAKGEIMINYLKVHFFAKCNRICNQLNRY